MYRFLSILTVLIIISTVPLVSSEVMRGEFTVPDWVKNTAGWWASEQIPDSAFLQGIQYLIKEGIMIVEIPTEIDSEAAEEVPGWVKNTAGWWAEDKIHDTTFVSGIEYLIGQGIIVVEQEVEEVVEEEVIEIKDFYMEVNGGSCSYCVNWADVGDEYYLQIETYDEQHGKYIDGVEISAKIISKGGELRHDFGEVTTEDGIYKNSITIPSMDWYAENILSVTGEYFGVEKTIEKEFDVFRNQGGTSGGYRAGASGCAHVGPYSISSQETAPQGIAFSKSGEKMFIVGTSSDAVNEYTLTSAYCIGTASFVDAFSISSQESIVTGIAFSRSGEKMFIVGINGDEVNEYTLTVAWDVSTASFVDAFSISSQDDGAHAVVFSKSGEKMYIVGDTGGADTPAGCTETACVYEYTLTVAWDISTASFVDALNVSLEGETAPVGIAFSKSGEKMFIAGDSGNGINEYTLTTAWDVSSASFVDSFSVNSQEASIRDIWFDSSGKTMFVVGKSGDDVNVYKLTTEWDVSTASFTG
jgi:WD40 repeat protein